ncbi:Isoaspartyl dipeptidase [Enhygromyxa salina]|uniref:Isoaspartyl dipeptidase n=1 Tax=Enhygromyxa salina TaxID=215803 RepID=A0A0C1ZLS6_9BACT|nr:beta-aspartyl-peptidase [Enhygromyxa salina]KIG11713.1 Isoaspartyl dipeptidase [Enhygromyxa salina]
MTPSSPPSSLTLLRNANLHAPAPLGRRDLLLAGGKLVAISQRDAALDPLPASLGVTVHDCAGAHVVPGLVDAHVHVTGGGGEGGYTSRVPPLSLTQLSLSGVTSVVGLLGTDATTRTMRELVARTYALREEGVSAWCWTGNYEVPVKTLTRSVRDDIVFVDPIIGVGELAISDHRSSQPSFDEFLRVAADVHVAGMISGKAGVLHLHLGDGERGLELIRRALDHSELPARVFHPTHLNRNLALFAEAQALVRERGANAPSMDLTAFPADDVGDGLSAADAIAAWKRAGLPLERLTCSSDGGGCMPHFDHQGQLHGYGVGQCATLLDTVRAARRDHGLELAELLPLFTTNVARLLRLRGKGELVVGADADLLILVDRDDQPLQLDGVIGRGVWLVREGSPQVVGPFEAGLS